MMTKQIRANTYWPGIVLCAFFVLLSAPHSPMEVSASPPQAIEQAGVKQKVSNIDWLGHASFCIKGNGIVIYTDPYKLKNGPKADLILITHDHYDHCSPADVTKVSKKDTVIVTVASAAAKLSNSIKIVKPGDELMVKGISITAVPAYNVNKFLKPGVPFHPHEAGHVGFVFTVDKQRIYHAGDTDCIPEMGTIDADIALLPVSGTYVMTAEEAVEAVRMIKPKVAVPMHIGRGIGSAADAERFKAKASVPVEILPMH